MKKIYLNGLLLAVSCFVVAGCCSTKEVPVTPTLPEGKDVIVKDAFDIAPINNPAIGDPSIYELFSPDKDNVRTSYSLSLIELKPGNSITKHYLASSETIFVFQGGGVLKIEGHAYILKPGISIYIPAGKNQTTLNDSTGLLRFATIICPPYNKKSETVLQKPVKKAQPATEDAANALVGTKPQKMGKTNLNDVQELTPQEKKVPDTPNN